MLSYSCRHCDKLDGKIKASGYDIQKLSKNQPITDAYEKDTCKDENVPVIVCDHPRCQEHWLESSPMPENWNVLQLHVAGDGDGDETPVQSNQRVKVISCADSDDGVPVNEVLHWLESVSWRGSITSIDGQGQKLHELTKGVIELNKNVKLVAERTGEMLEKQDQTNTGIEMLCK